MMYLVRTDNWIKECKSWSEVKRALLEACADWINDKNYISDKRYETPEKLFELGFNDRDFGDVAQVFEVRCASDPEDDWYYFDCCSPQDTFTMKRIF